MTSSFKRHFDNAMVLCDYILWQEGNLKELAANLPEECHENLDAIKELWNKRNEEGNIFKDHIATNALELGSENFDGYQPWELVGTQLGLC